MVGYFNSTNSDLISFLYSGGTFTPIQYPGAMFTIAEGINDSGQIVGTYGGSGITYGFIYSGGVFTSLSPPGSIFSDARGINNAGIVVGAYNTCIHPACEFGYLYTIGGSYSSFDSPTGEIAVDAAGINDLGQIVGNYIDPSTFIGHGFVDIGGTFTPLNYPGITPGDAGTNYGINNSGQIVGYLSRSSIISPPPSGVPEQPTVFRFSSPRLHWSSEGNFIIHSFHKVQLDGRRGQSRSSRRKVGSYVRGNGFGHAIRCSELIRTSAVPVCSNPRSGLTRNCPVCGSPRTTPRSRGVFRARSLRGSPRSAIRGAAARRRRR
jgi:hypothetical protein